MQRLQVQERELSIVVPGFARELRSGPVTTL